MGRLTDAVVIVDDDGIADGHIRGAVDVPTIRVRSRAARVGDRADTKVAIANSVCGVLLKWEVQT